MQTLALAKRLRRMHPGFETPIFYYRPYPGNPIADAARESRLRVSARARAVGRLRLRRRPRTVDHGGALAERRALQVLHAARLAARRVALAAPGRVALALRPRLVRVPVEKALVELVRPPQQVS